MSNMDSDSVPQYLRRPHLSALDDVTSGLYNRAPSHCNTLGCTCRNTDYPPEQQDLTSKPFYNALTDGGLDYVYAKLNLPHPQDHYRKTTHHRKHVIVVGAGTSGLSAAYELRQAGHQVTLLEIQHRVGGRTKTIKDKFSDGLHAEGGAMRLPESHYLTKHYIDLFNVPTRPFQNQNLNGFLSFYGDPKIKMSEWDANSDWYCTKYWEGWDAKIMQFKTELGIKGINDYFDSTVAPVYAELRRDPSPKGWARWVKKWSQFSVLEFLKSDTYQSPADKYKLRPWPQKAIEAYTVRNYIPLVNASLVEYLRELLGQWWKDPLYTPTGGMEEIAKAFMRKNTTGWNPDVDLSKDIRYGIKVEAIEEVQQRNGEKIVRVTGRNDATKQSAEFTGDAVIITVPLTVLRQMKVPLTRPRQQAVEGIYYEASTKILLQCRTRFWQNPDNLQGGFSKTNLPIGQLHYPDWEKSGIPENERGILVIYTWGQDAEMFGAQKTEEAIENAVKQVATIHPEIVDNFEVGAVQAWFNEPTAQGAFVYLKPDQYNDSLLQLLRSDHPIYLAGEALSWSNGWIQGALESGLRAAYEFYSYNEKQFPPQMKRCGCAHQYVCSQSEGEMSHHEFSNNEKCGYQGPLGQRSMYPA
ncbi:putative L-amino-acid oxidase YobN isoform X1 [Haliotis cracherodii]|uniref:putative L-amino-acid oxidase YobN isoform X1 n=2 Tax=Haliotis cracherodii TaxID=6455 RepID=UPI0039E820EC